MLCNQFQFISSDVFGVFGNVFCDFGDAFDVFDSSGEEPKEVFISNISKVCLEFFIFLQFLNLIKKKYLFIFKKLILNQFFFNLIKQKSFSEPVVNVLATKS